MERILAYLTGFLTFILGFFNSIVFGRWWRMRELCGNVIENAQNSAMHVAIFVVRPPTGPRGRRVPVGLPAVVARGTLLSRLWPLESVVPRVGGVEICGWRSPGASSGRSLVSKFLVAAGGTRGEVHAVPSSGSRDGRGEA